MIDSPIFERMGYSVLDYLNYIEDNFKVTTPDGERLVIDGYVYNKRCRSKETTYWQCPNYRKRECPARAITVASPLVKGIYVRQGPELSTHNHPPILEEKYKLRGQFLFDPLMIPYLEYFATQQPSSGWLRRRRRFFIHDQQSLQEFFERYSTNYQVFDPRIVAETIKTIYATMWKQIAGYAAVMEFRSQIERDHRKYREKIGLTVGSTMTSGMGVPITNLFQEAAVVRMEILVEPEPFDEEIGEEEGSIDMGEIHDESNSALLGHPVTPMEDLSTLTPPRESPVQFTIPSMSRNFSNIQNIQSGLPLLSAISIQDFLRQAPPREAFADSMVPSTSQSSSDVQEVEYKKEVIPPVPGSIPIHHLPPTPPRESSAEFAPQSISLTIDENDLNVDCKVEKVIPFIDLSPEDPQVTMNPGRDPGTTFSGDQDRFLTDPTRERWLANDFPRTIATATHVYAPYCAYNVEEQDNDYNQDIPAERSKFRM